MFNPKAGDVIRVVSDNGWRGTEVYEYKLEEFRFTLGFFKSDDHRTAGIFTALSDSELWVDGPDTKNEYICNFGSYRSNQVPAFEVIRQ